MTNVLEPIELHVTDEPFVPRTARFGAAQRDRLAHLGLLVGTALLYLVGLSRSGWANQFYAAAAQAGAKSWKAMLFGSLDASNFITVDKPPASLWVMDLSVRFFGTNSWAILVPQALEGVAAVAVLYAAVRRVSTPTAGLIAGAALATTPVAALMFRFNNPDALLVLLMTGAAYATVRAVEHARARWIVLAGVLLGFAFLTKMLQGMIVVPAFAAAYLVAAPTSVWARVRHLLAAGGAMIVAAGWWIAVVELWPAGSRPFIGGSTNNSILELAFGYNGFGRLTGADNNGAVGGGTGGFSSSQTGLFRLFGSEMGTQISWLLPAALVGLGALVWLTHGRPRTDALRASAIVWGGWLVVNGLVFSYASGIIHPYYTVALAPAIAALVGLGVAELWRRRSDIAARYVLAGLIAAAAVWSYQLLGRASWHPELRWLVVVAGAVAVVLLLVGWLRAVVLAPLVALALLAAPTAYALQTASTGHTGAIPSAGPASSGGFGGGPGGFGRGGFGRGGFGGGGFGGGAPTGGFGGGPGGFGGAGTATGGTGATSGGTATGGTGATTGGTATGGGTAPGGFGGGLGGTRGGFGGGGAGGLGGAATVSSALKSALTANASAYTWVAATVGDNEAASLELATGKSVMALGGYNGTDPSIMLAQFKTLVAAGRIHYYIANSQGFIGSTAADTSTAYQIQQWIASTYTATTIGGSTVYDLTK